jgi:hypothetical protein
MVAKAFSGDDPQGLSTRARELAGTYDGQGGGAYNLGLALQNTADAFGRLFGTIVDGEPGSTSALQTFANALNGIADAINRIQAAYAKAKEALSFLAPVNNAISNVIGPQAFFTRLTNPIPKRAAGGPVMGGQAYRVGEFGPETFIPAGSGSIRPGGGGGNTVININAVIDAESARRSIEKLLQDSARRTGPINLVGANL